MTQGSSSYQGISVTVKVSGVREFEAQGMGVNREEADQQVRQRVQQEVEALYPGLAVNVETGGDEPTAEVSGTDDPRTDQMIRYDARRIALRAKWDCFLGVSRT